MPARFAPLLFAFILSSMMSLVVSGIATLRNAGPFDGFLGNWLGAWLPSFPIAFPVVLVLIPLVRRIVAAIVVAPGGR